MNNPTDLNVDLLRQDFPDWSIEYITELPSTNQYFMHNAATIPSPAVVVAQNQTAGRGRGSNRWWSTRGALTFSLMVSPESHEIPRTEYSLLSLMTAALVRESILSLTGIESNRLLMKWPNDLYLDGKKLCGILLEQPGRSPGTLVIGIGINVNNSFDNAPEDVSGKAISLIDLCTTPIDPTGLLSTIIDGTQQLLSSQQKRKQLFPNSWDSAHLLDQRLITIDQSGKQSTGRCEGIDETGALILRDMYGVHQIHSAVILSWDD